MSVTSRLTQPRRSTANIHSLTLPPFPVSSGSLSFSLALSVQDVSKTKIECSCEFRVDSSSATTIRILTARLTSVICVPLASRETNQTLAFNIKFPQRKYGRFRDNIVICRGFSIDGKKDSRGCKNLCVVVKFQS